MTQLQKDIAFVKDLLPVHYRVEESKKKYSIHCASIVGMDDSVREPDWKDFMQKIREHFGNRFMEVFHNVYFRHTDFTIYLEAQQHNPLPPVLLIDHSALPKATIEQLVEIMRNTGYQFVQKPEELQVLSIDEATSEFTGVMREADKVFETVGGSTRHYVRDVLLPLLEQAGLFICKKVQAEQYPLTDSTPIFDKQ